MMPEQRTAWDIDAARVREIAALIDAASVERPEDAEATVALANEAQVDLLQVRWRPIERDGGPPYEEWSALYRMVNDACVRWNRRRLSLDAQRSADAVADGVRAALARVPELTLRCGGRVGLRAAEAV